MSAQASREHGHGLGALAPFRQHRRAGFAGQAKIEDHGIIGLGFAQVLRVNAVVDQVDRAVLAAQLAGNRFAQVGIVFNKQDAHGRSIPLHFKPNMKRQLQAASGTAA